MHESWSNKVKSVITWDFWNHKQTKRGLQREFSTWGMMTHTCWFTVNALVMGLIVNPTQDRRVWRMTWLSYTQQLYNHSNMDKNTAENKQNTFTWRTLTASFIIQRWLTKNMLKYPQFSRLSWEALSAAGEYAEGSRASLSLFFIRYQQENKHTMAENKPKIGVKITGSGVYVSYRVMVYPSQKVKTGKSLLFLRD